VIVGGRLSDVQPSLICVGLDLLRPNVYWVREIPDLLFALMPRPRGGEWLAQEISGWHDAGIRTVVSLLEWDEAVELGLDNEEALCHAVGLRFISFPIPDRGVPGSDAGFAGLINSLVERLHAGEPVAVHCRAGIGRSGLVSACVLGALGVATEPAFAMLSRARGVAVPDTEAQAEWVREFMRGRSGTTRR
jgi:protein-tyrosine phosphatase